MESVIILNYGIVIKNMIPFWAYDFGFSLAATKETLEPMVRMFTEKNVFFPVHFVIFIHFYLILPLFMNYCSFFQLEKVTMAIQKSSRLVQDLVQMVNKTSSISTGSPSSDISNRPSSTSTPETSRSESVTPKLEMMNNSIAIVKTESLLKVPEMSSFRSNSEHNSDFRPAIKTEPQLTAWEMSISKQYDTTASHNHTSKRLIKTEPHTTELMPWEKNFSKHESAASRIKTEPQLTAVTPSEMSLIPSKQLETIAMANSGSVATIKSEPHFSVIKPELSSPPSNSKHFEMLSGHNLASIAEIKTEPQMKAVTPEIDLLESDSEQSDRLNSEFKLKLSKTSEILSLSGDSEQSKTNSETDNDKTDPHVTPETPSEMSSAIASADTACLETNQAEPESTTTTSEVSLLQSVSEEPETIASDNTTLIETNQTEPEAATVTSPDVSPLPSDSEEPENIASCDSESMDKPTTRSKSAKPSVSTTSPSARLRSSKNSTSVTSTSSPEKETRKAQSPEESIDEPSDTEDQPASPIPSDEPPESPSKPPPNQTPTTDETTPNEDSAEPSKHKKSKLHFFLCFIPYYINLNIT